jgi:hypothetical protein
MAYLFSRLAFVLIGLLFALGAIPSQAADAYSPEELEQLVAPIALYPDPLLSQVLMASTYPLEIVEAARWRAGQPQSLSDRQLSGLLADKPWDPSVKAVAAFPDVLEMMNEKISWTGQLGNAFLDQQEDVMAAVQRLRARAQAAGNLQSGPQQTVTVSGSPSVIAIAPAQPDTIYVPIYNPTVIYGPWPYPGYVPYYWHPPRYVVRGPVITFSTAFIVGGVLWSTYDWHHRRFDINVHRYNRFNRARITGPIWHREFEQRRAAAHRHATIREHYGNPRHTSPPGPMPDRPGPRHAGPPADNRSSFGHAPPGQGVTRTPPPAEAPHGQIHTRTSQPPSSSMQQPQQQPQQRPPQQQSQARPQPHQPPHRAPGGERPANVTRTHEFHNEAAHARPPAERQAQRQEHRQEYRQSHAPASGHHERNGGDR